ncbi:MAG: peptidoglycan endopeptidase [Akkermansia sp.]|nr:peptidoglycan endopeptidase [Akkermansia sp.]MBR2313861.1 peptidoglycan endopeptidase [Akkermansia sp.]
MVMRQMSRILSILVALVLLLGLNGCQQQLQRNARTPKYVYRAGQTPKKLRNGKVTIPYKAPPRIKRAIAAGNRIVGKPYRLGGGHGKHHDSAYDCSGSVAFILHEAGMLKKDSYPSSRDFLKWGHAGFGKWLTLYAKRGHVFLVIAGMRFDTTGTSRGVGPRWYTESRPCGGFYVRHVPGL